MAGIFLIVNQGAETAFKVVAGAARALHYTVTCLADGELSLRRGSLIAGLVVGPFVPYCDFRVSFHSRERETEIRLELNKPWWTGTIGLKRVRGRAEELAGAIDLAVREAGGTVLKRNSF
jgi:hypothetical protein